MLSQRIHEKISGCVKGLQRFADRPWYPLVVGLLAALDNVLLVIPTDGILISSSMLAPRKWSALALSSAVGSTLGALVLALLVRDHGLALVLHLYPGLEESASWVLTLRFFNEYGLFLVFLVSITPLAQQPAVILTALSLTPIFHMAFVIFFGRSIKFFIMAYVGSHAPRLLNRLWGVKGELKDAGVHLDGSDR